MSNKINYYSFYDNHRSIAKTFMKCICHMSRDHSTKYVVYLMAELYSIYILSKGENVFIKSDATKLERIAFSFYNIVFK